MSETKTLRLTARERNYLMMGIEQPGGKLPLFDAKGQRINPTIIKSCMRKGYAARWFANPIKPDWLVCRLTPEGRDALT